MKYKRLVSLYDELGKTTKRLEKTNLISKFLKNIEDNDIESFSLMINGKVFPVWSDKKIGVATRLVIKAISKSTGASEKIIEKEWERTGDLGLVVQELISKKKQISLFPKELNLNDVFSSLRNLSGIQGQGSIEKKIDVISDLIISSSPDEAKYIVRTVIENMRVGIGQGTLRDSIIWAFFDKEIGIKFDNEKKSIELDEEQRKKYNDISNKVQNAIDISNDISTVIKTIKSKGLKGLESIKLIAGKPINVMLYQKSENIEEAFEIVGKPAAFEYKYDGFRLQIHRIKDKIILFTRRLEDVTEQFPDIIPVLKNNINGTEYILDAEIVGFDSKTKEYLPFQKISQRIRRKYDIKEIATKFPVEINVFDLLFFDGQNYLNKPYEIRRKKLELEINQIDKKIVLAKQIITDNEKEAIKFYNESIKVGEEGVMAKNLKGIYKPGSRVGYGVKIKPTLEPLDLVIIGAEWGEGKRKGWLSSFTLACFDENKEEFLKIGKVSTGLKEIENDDGVSFKKMTELLKPLIKKSIGKNVETEPKIIIEVGYEEIQKSVNYSSGYALRFPRFIRLREDKPLEEINDINDVEQFFLSQRGRK